MVKAKTLKMASTSYIVLKLYLNAYLKKNYDFLAWVVWLLDLFHRLDGRVLEIIFHEADGP